MLIVQFLLHQGTGLQLSMDNGHVVMEFVGKTFKSKKQYQDGKWHYLTASKRGARYDGNVS